MSGQARQSRTDVRSFTELSLGRIAERAIAEVVRRRSDMSVQADPGLADEMAIERLFAAATGDDPRECSRAARDLLAEGIAPERICDEYIPETARRMGDGWTDDTMSFSAVTIGCARLQYLLREIGQNEGDDRRRNVDGDESGALLLIALQASHTLGIMVLAERLRRSGYTVRVSFGESAETVVETIRTTRFDGIFLSASIDEGILGLADMVGAIRGAIPELPPVVLGGIAIDGGVDVRVLTGVDLVTSDVDAALRHCGLTDATQGNI